MSDTPAGAHASEPSGDGRVHRVRRIALSEDWAATIAGLLIIAVVLVGLWPGWLVP